MNNLTPQEIAESLEYQAAHTISMPDKDRAALEQAATYIRKIANGELRPTIHAHWIETDSFTAECSSCGEWCEEDNNEEYPAHCPYCGAVMDETESNHE